MQDILENDEDLAMLYVTYRAQTGTTRNVSEHHEAEVILEEYLKQVEEIANELAELRANIESTEAVLNIELSSARNRIMRLDLVLTSATFSASMGALGAGLFGMNLTSHLESHPSMFYLMSGALSTGAVATFLSIFYYCRRKHIL